MAAKKITLSDVCYFITASVFLYFCQLLIIFIPFRWYIHLFKVHAKGDLEQPTSENILVVRKALLMGLHYIPWSGKCLVQALTGKLLLKMFHLPGTIYFGMTKGNDILKAHAWLKSGDHFVSGKKGHKNFTVVQEIS